MTRTTASALESLGQDLAAGAHRRSAVEPWDAWLTDELVRSLLP